MFVSVLLNTEYMDISSRKMWYLKNLLHCKENGWALITHQYLGVHFKELQDTVSERFFNEFEMRPFSMEEVKDVEQYYIPDELFAEKEKECGSRTLFLFYQEETVYPELKECFEKILGFIEDKHPGERIEGILHCLESPRCLREICKQRGIALISYSFSACRKVHGYQQTLFQANVNTNYWSASDFRERFTSFSQENASVPFFSNEELLVLLGKTRNIPLILLINNRPEYELGICCDCFSIQPQSFIRNRYTDDDVFYEARKLYPREKVQVRSHAAHLNELQIDRSGIHDDPAPFILSCKRICAVSSQILLKALLWKRTAIMKTDCLGLSSLCSDDYASETIIDLKALNYYLFGYLVPMELMFSKDYWSWRLGGPKESEVFFLHLNYILNRLGIPKFFLSENPVNRFNVLMDWCGCDDQLKEALVKQKKYVVDWSFPSSKIVVCFDDNTSQVFWLINEKIDSERLSTDFSLNVKNRNVSSIVFFPFDDVAAFAAFESVVINGEERMKSPTNSLVLFKKREGCLMFPISQITESIKIRCIWRYKSINDYLNS